jgi:hypothetical protein
MAVWTPNITVLFVINTNEHYIMTIEIDPKIPDFKLSPCCECRILCVWVIIRSLNFMCRRFGTLYEASAQTSDARRNTHEKEL